MADEYTKKEEPQALAVSCQQRYERLKVEREPFLRRAREAAVLTLPALMPPEGHSGATELHTPFQSAGAEGVNSLASKLLLALLPPDTAFFRLQMDDMQKEQLLQAAEQSGQDVVGEVERGLGKIERAVLNRLEQVGARITFFDALKHLLVCGNVLVQVLDKGAMKLHYLDHYVVKRDGAGNVLEIICLERIAKEALPAEAKQIAEEYVQGNEEEKKQESCNVYTRVYRNGTTYRVCQELFGKEIPGTEGVYPLDKSAWIPLRYVQITGQDYGRGRVEEYLGDFVSLEGLSQSIVEGTAIGVKTVFLVNEAGVTSKQALQDAANGDIIDGDVRDVGTLKVEKVLDLQVASAKTKELEERIAKAFLVHQQRQAERVTAEEVRAVIAELEKALGGTYAILAQEFQLPVVKRIMVQMQKERAIPALPENIIAPKIITGLEALGRGSDFQKLRALIAETAQEFGPDAIAEYINVGAYMHRVATALQIDIEGIVRSEEEVQKSREERMRAELAAKLGPATIKGEVDRERNQMAAQAAQPSAQ
jgi:hypothetical protein